MQGFYARLRVTSKHDTELQECVERVVNRLEASTTSENQPGMLLGKIQSGKTRGFLGIIAKSFDRDYDIAVVLTKGTRTLAQQTVSRISHDFKEFIKDDLIAVYDIMEMPSPLTRSELKRKIIIVAKKEVNNLNRVIGFFNNPDYIGLLNKKVLLVDDEADMASVRFVPKRGHKDDYSQGSIAQIMDNLRDLVPQISFLQVTATPYALYLQPEEYIASPSNPFVFFAPKKPSFTEILPVHGGYVGGEDYFGEHPDVDPRNYLYVPVQEQEHNALRSDDGRAIRTDRIWTSQNINILRESIMNFLAAVVIRRWQQTEQELRPGKYAMIIHNDTQKAAHRWQFDTVEKIRLAFEAGARDDEQRFNELFSKSFDNISKSVIANAGRLPDKEFTKAAVIELILDGDLIVQKVNSDVQVASLLDPETAELKLRTPANIFIGGSLLDRGITIPSLISFYYGRNPKRMQADTVLQHSRMYGNRDRQDLAVTRFYTSQAVYDRLKQIDTLEKALRDEFVEKGAEASVVFIQSDSKSGITPCAPNKVAMSNITTIRSSQFYTPIHFDTLAGQKAKRALAEIDEKVDQYQQEGILHDISLETAIELVTLTQGAIALTGKSFEWEAMTSLFSYYSKNADNSGVKLLVARDREIDRQKTADKTGRSIIGGQSIRDLVVERRKEPVLALIRQKGKDYNWSGNMAFWWPVIVSPAETAPCVFSSKK
ncbi:MAG: hypothetical protein EOO06_13735 [Chitinophagaceae bacterium]|nr:MAG: hypothetical protein EOO06_13735 [Chitinophagaceae bacterium]